MSVAPSSTRPRQRNRRGEGDLLRSEILTAATTLLDESGSEESVTLRAVARRAGISAPSIYAHFPDRQAILLAIVQAAFAELTTELQAAAERSGLDSDHEWPGPVVDLRAVCSAYLHFATTRPQRYRSMFGGVWNAARALESDSVSHVEIDALGQAALEVLVTTLAACVANGDSRSTDPRADAVALWLGLHGLAHQRAVSTAFPWPADIVERLIEPLTHLSSSGGAARPRRA